MKKYLFSGLAILLPIAFTLLVFIFLIDLLTDPFKGIIENSLSKVGDGIIDTKKYHGVLTFLSRVIVIILLFFGTLLLGFLGQRFLFKKLFKYMHETFLKIPFIKGIYGISIDITKSFVGKTGKIFRNTVVVPFPHKDSRAIGFLTGDAPDEIQKIGGKDEVMKSVFVPTAPHPISGFLVMLGETQIKNIDMSTEEAFKFLVSCGLYFSEKERKEKEQ